ncbi:MAG: hypothetical protein ACPLW8_05260 [Candidatus Bathyarchaeales archaeon]
MFNLKKGSLFIKLLVLYVTSACLLVALTACGGKPSITGKWEQISGEPSLIFFGGAGTLWEFFDDGTVSIGVMGNVAGKYSWPDGDHLKIEFAQGQLVYEFTRSGNEITLKDPSTQSVIILQRYEELSPSPQSLAGTWQKGAPDDSQCFAGLGLDSAPGQVSFAADGTFSAQEEASFLSTGVSLYGQFSVEGKTLHISATGTKTETGLFGGTSQEQIGGELICQVTVSHSRLLFKDNQNRTTLYVIPNLPQNISESPPTAFPTEVPQRRIEVYWTGGAGGPEIYEIFGVSPTPGTPVPVEIGRETEELGEIIRRDLAPYVLSLLGPETQRVALSLYYVDPEKGTAVVCASSIPEKEGEVGQILAVGRFSNGEIVGFPIFPKEGLVVSKMGRVFKAEEVDGGIAFSVVSSVDRGRVVMRRLFLWPKGEFNFETGEWGRVGWQAFLEKMGFKLGEGWERIDGSLSEGQWNDFEESLRGAVRQAILKGKDRGEIKVRMNKKWLFPEAYFSFFPPSEFGGIKIDGLKEVWNGEKGRWEYVDPQDYLVAGFWDEEGERFELTADRLRGRWRGLYVPVAPDESERLFSEAWGKGEMRFAIPFKLSGPTGQEEIVERITTNGKSVFCLRYITPGTILYAPFGGRGVKFGNEDTAGIDLIWNASSCRNISRNCDNPTLSIFFKSFADLIASGWVEAGTAFLKISGKTLSKELDLGQFKDCQVALAFIEADWDVGFSLTLIKNLQRDEQGRFKYIAP